MKIVVDDKIPYILPALRELAEEVVVKGGSEICAADVRDADILVVRTRTRCDRALLEGSRVQLVVTATIGYDHLDTTWLEAAGIAWANCPGCNATSVAQYIRNSLLVLSRERGLDLMAATIGIVGLGHVGTAVAQALQSIGCRHLLFNDPPLEASPARPQLAGEWVPLSRIEAEADIITFHTPLTRTGPYPTLHLADEAFFAALGHRPGRIILNAARGGVVDEAALLRAMDSGVVAEAIIDTWEGEPAINGELLRRAFIATPHIAGYSADGKANATRMVLTRICQLLNRPMTFEIQPPALPTTSPEPADPIDRFLLRYDPQEDTRRLREHPDAFEWQRGHYPLRRE